MTAICPAPNSQQRSASISDLVSDEAHDKSYSRLVGRIWIRPVNYGALVQRHLARLQYHIYRAGLIYEFNSLAAPDKIGIVGNIDVIQLPLLMRPGDHAQATVSVMARR